ncbi:transposase [Desulfovibrio inopinatus]|uniref:transposase n=1 Tax=Desulfovibrio inopinatus TaxID=102109 RepID=UPI00041BE3C4|nr:transposase [Desulfovibrio inopinatus]
MASLPASNFVLPSVDLCGLFEDDASAYTFFSALCREKDGFKCPKCSHDKVYDLASGRRRCASCKYTFHEFSRRFINVGALSFSDWAKLLRYYAEEDTANRMAPKLQLAYNTVYKAVTTLRFAILAQAMDAPQFLSGGFGSELGFEGGRIKHNTGRERLSPIPVFGLIERNGRIFIDLLPQLEALSVFHFNYNFSLKLVRMGNLIYTDRYQRYDALIFCGDDSLPYHCIRKYRHKAFVDEQSGGFWHFARARLARYNGVTPRRFPLYIKELEFRYNHQDKELFPLLAQALCSLVPNYD